MGDDLLAQAKTVIETGKSWAVYLWLFCLALMGGAANYYSRVKSMRLPFSLVELAGEFLISGFAGIMMMLACQEWEATTPVTGIMTGLAGHYATRALYLLQNVFFKIPPLKTPDDKTT